MRHNKLRAGLTAVTLLAICVTALPLPALAVPIFPADAATPAPAAASNTYEQGYTDGIQSGRMDLASGIGYTDNCNQGAYSADYCAGFTAGYREAYSGSI